MVKVSSSAKTMNHESFLLRNLCHLQHIIYIEIAYFISQLGSHFIRYSCCYAHGSNPSRLGTTNFFAILTITLSPAGCNTIEYTHSSRVYSTTAIMHKMYFMHDGNS